MQKWKIIMIRPTFCRNMLCFSIGIMMASFTHPKHSKVSYCFFLFFLANFECEMKRIICLLFFAGFRAIGCGVLLSSAAAVFINLGLSHKTRPVNSLTHLYYFLFSFFVIFYLPSSSDYWSWNISILINQNSV